MSSMDWIMAQQKTEASSQCVVKTTHWNYTPVYTVNCQHHRQFQLTPKTTASTLNEINTQLTGHGIQSSPEKNGEIKETSRGIQSSPKPQKRRRRDQRNHSHKNFPQQEKNKVRRTLCEISMRLPLNTETGFSETQFLKIKKARGPPLRPQKSISLPPGEYAVHFQW